LFGGMVVARVLRPTGLFETLGGHFMRFVRGSGRRFLLALVALVIPLCAFLPNATTILLIAPVVIAVAAALEVDFVPPLILAVVLSNVAGLLTLVGDPATFLVGSSISMTFNAYLETVSLGAAMCIVATVALVPVLFRPIWRVRAPYREVSVPRIERPGFAIATLLILLAMIVLFVVGESTLQLGPPAIAILGATLALLALTQWKVEAVNHILADVDWRALIFIYCLFVMVDGLTGTPIVAGLYQDMADLFGTDLVGLAFVLLAGLGVLSGFLANTPLVLALLLLVKGYFVAVGLMPEQATGSGFADWPDFTVPVFIAMMFGATLGGNATLIGATSNIVAAGVAAHHGRPISFVRFLRYGVPLTVAQLAVAALYVGWLCGAMGTDVPPPPLP